jgi:hypothetical protein
MSSDVAPTSRTAFRLSDAYHTAAHATRYAKPRDIYCGQHWKDLIVEHVR